MSQHGKSQKSVDDVRRRLTAMAAQQRVGTPANSMSRFLHERAQRWMLWARKQRGMPTGESIRELVASGELTEYKHDPREAAQEYAFEAMEAEDIEEQHFLALKALQFDPACMDAQRVVADRDASSHIDRVARLKKSVMLEEERLADVITEFQGSYSDAVELMPLLRTRIDLASALWAGGRVKRARQHLEALYTSDADDAVGARYPLLMTRLYLGDHEGAAELLERADAESAELLVRWARVLQLVLAGDMQAAGAAYDDLREVHQGEARSLASPPPAEFAFPGFFRDEITEYAALCLRMLHWAWHAHDASRTWLMDCAASEAAASTATT